jgi:hypothetical protein
MRHPPHQGSPAVCSRLAGRESMLLHPAPEQPDLGDMDGEPDPFMCTQEEECTQMELPPVDEVSVIGLCIPLDGDAHLDEYIL